MRESFSLCEKNLYSQPVSRRRNNREHGYLQCYTCNSTPASRISLSGCLPLVPCTLSLFPPLLPALLFKNMQQETGLAARSSTPFNRVYVRAMEKKKKKFIYRCQRMVKNYTLVAVLASNLSRGAAPALRFFFREPIVPDEYFKTNTRNFYPMFARFTALPMFLLFDLGRGTRRFIDSFHAPRLLSPPPATRYIVFLRPNKSRFTHQSRTLIYRGVARLRLCTVRVFIIRESNCFTGHTISSLRP